MAETRWLVLKRGKQKAGPFRDVYAAYHKAKQVKGDLVKAVIVSSRGGDHVADRRGAGPAVKEPAMEELCYSDLPFTYWEVLRSRWDFNWKKSFLVWCATPGAAGEV